MSATLYQQLKKYCCSVVWRSCAQPVYIVPSAAALQVVFGRVLTHRWCSHCNSHAALAKVLETITAVRYPQEEFGVPINVT
eukprot:12974-Heterococcus_DN1.PRE.3